MTDLEDLRKRYASRPDACPCGEPYRHADTRTCARCQRVHAADPSVLALCDEVEAIRAQVAAAPVVLREWPRTAAEAPGEWFLALHGARAPRGEFEPNGERLPLFRDDDGDIWPPHEFEPGEFFVRVP